MKRHLKNSLLIFVCMQAWVLADLVELKILDNEYWWAGLSSHGYKTPYDASTVDTHDLWGDNKGNQAQPLLLSSKGRFVWSEDPIKYSFDRGKITITTRSGKIESGTNGRNLRDVYAYVSQTYFPSNGKIPDELLFTHPQYNTWIELMYDQNEKDILKYAQAIIDNGYPPGVLMIDDNWQENYGTWEFSPRRFQDPKGMMEKLHAMGFKVMLWVCPFVSADSVVFRELAAKGMLLLDPQKTQEILWANTKNKAALIRWWNGASACLDLSNPKTQAWFKEKLDYLVEEYGVDGFKFDAGDARFYINDIVSWQSDVTPNDHTQFFAEFGLNYPLNEYRASWKMAGLPLAQRLRDKGHEWEDLAKLIPDQMSQSVMGYAYTCPDMIGGGEYRSFLNADTMDEELVVRSAQVHALMPMMQFSVAPWRILSQENQKICLDMAKLHLKMGDKILGLAKAASKTGEPIVKPMAMAFPDAGYEQIKDQFVLGEDIIVAPVVKKSQRSRKVVLPAGQWKADDGRIHQGGGTINIDVPLERLPYFTLESSNASAIKFNAGHYIAVGVKEDLTQIPELKSDAIQGVNKRYSWRVLEPKKGRYDFSEIEKDLAYLESINKQLVVFFTDKTFSPKSRNPVPEYMRHATVINHVKGITTLKWHPEVIERQIKLCEELSKRFDDNPCFEGLAYQESAPSVRYDKLATISYTPELLRDGLIELLIGSAEAFPRSRIFWYMNFIPRNNDYINDVAAAVAPYHVVMGGPDILPYRKSLQRIEGVHGRFKDKMALFGSAQYDSYRHHKLDDNNNTKARFHRGEVPIATDGYVTMDEIFFHGRDKLHLDYLFWTYKQGRIKTKYPGDPDDHVFADALIVIEKYPEF